MKKDLLIPTKIYFIVICTLILSRGFRFFMPHENTYVYLHILSSFDPLYTYLYYLNLIQIIFNIFHIIPLFNYIYRIPLFTQKFWQRAFILKIISDIFGCSYEIMNLKAAIHSGLFFFSCVAIASAAIYLPFYFMCYGYAFKDQKIFKETL